VKIFHGRHLALLLSRRPGGGGKKEAVPETLSRAPEEEAISNLLDPLQVVANGSLSISGLCAIFRLEGPFFVTEIKDFFYLAHGESPGYHSLLLKRFLRV
jgi:hypothetical protein